MKRTVCLLSTLLLIVALLCGCTSSRPEFDTARITYVHQTGDEDSREVADLAVLNELWEMYTDLKVYDINRPMGLPYYSIEYLKDGEVVDSWKISQDYVVSGGRFGGNHTLADTVEITGDSIWYDRITALFELCS